MRKTKIIAIDPDFEKNGIAVMDIEARELQTLSLSFPEAVAFISEKAREGDVRVVIEAGWKVRKANFHGYRDSVAQKIARDVGANHASGQLLMQMLRSQDVEVEEVPPLRHNWKGRDGKITHAELKALLPWLPYKRTNQDVRDAILLAWTHGRR